MGSVGEIPIVDELVLFVLDVSTPIKAAWVLFLVWSLIQIIWRRRALVVPPPAPLRPMVRRPSPAVGPLRRPSTLRGGSPEFLAALGLQEPTPVPSVESTSRT